MFPTFMMLPSTKRVNHALPRMTAGRRGCNRCASWPPSLSRVVARFTRVMTFKRSVWWGFGGAGGVTLAAWFIVGASQALTDALTHLFLSIGLNPREQGLFCVLLFVTFTSLVGFVAGRGLQFRSP